MNSGSIFNTKILPSFHYDYDYVNNEVTGLANLKAICYRKGYSDFWTLIKY